MQDIRVCTMKRDENKLFLIGYKKTIKNIILRYVISTINLNQLM